MPAMSTDPQHPRKQPSLLSSIAVAPVAATLRLPILYRTMSDREKFHRTVVAILSHVRWAVPVRTRAK